MKTRFSYWTQITKPQVLKGLELANITDKKARKTILNFEKRICTLYNKQNNGVSSETLCYTDAYMVAQDLIEDLNAGGMFGYEDAKYWKEWKQYCKTREFVPTLNIGDCLA